MPSTGPISSARSSLSTPGDIDRLLAAGLGGNQPGFGSATAATDRAPIAVLRNRSGARRPGDGADIDERPIVRTASTLILAQWRAE
jgi:hypothetical protein